MVDKRPKITPDVQRLIDMKDEVVYAKDIAPIVRIHPQTIVDYAKSGRWDQDTLGKFVISGDRVKFFRRDFLQKCGFIDPEPEEPTERDVLIAIIDGLKSMLEAQKETIMLLKEQTRLLEEACR